VTRRTRRASSLAAIVLASAAAAAAAHAAEDKFYVGAAGTGNWSTFQNWSPSGAPLAEDNALLTPADGAARTVLYNVPGGALVTLGSATVAPTGAGTIALLNSNNQFRSELLVVGPRGSFAQPQNASAVVTETRLQGGTISSIGGPYAANHFEHTGGHLSAGSFVVTGTYRLFGGTISGATIRNEGTFDYISGSASGGTLINNGTLIYGATTGSLNLHVENRGRIAFNADMRVLSFESFSSFELPEFASLRASTSGFGFTLSDGTFTQRGNVIADKFRLRGGAWVQHSGVLSANTSPGQFLVGTDGGRGEYQIHGGEAFFADELKLGLQGSSGYVLQTGGTVAALRPPVIGAAGGTGYYEFDDGTLTAPGLLLGQTGAQRGALGQSAGSISIGTLLISEDGEAGGEYGISGGALHVASTTINNGVILQSGGATRFDGGITGGGRIDIGGGSLTAHAIVQDSMTLYGQARVRTTAGSAQAASEVRKLAFLEPGARQPSGHWDLGEGRLIVTDLSATPTSLLREYLVSGFDGGNWTGPGLNSSAAAQSGDTALGYASNGSVLVIAHALYGDADLSGAVNIADFARLAVSFNGPSEWSGGDFNYDGVTTIADFARLASNFNRALPAEPSRSTPVPDPTGAAGVIAAAATIFSHRRRR
jgi:hypothetical protein